MPWPHAKWYAESLFDVYQNVKSTKELCDSLESKFMAEDASSNKFLVSNFMNSKIIRLILSTTPIKTIIYAVRNRSFTKW